MVRGCKVFNKWTIYIYISYLIFKDTQTDVATDILLTSAINIFLLKSAFI